MRQAGSTETPGTRSAQALTIIAQNIDLAANGEGAICQDTGMPTFEIKTPVGVNQIAMKKVIRDAVAEATRRGKLRPNSVDSITGENSGDNLGPGTPILHFEQWDRDDEIEIQVDPQGRRLREHERAVLAADRAGAPRPRGPHARRRSQMHPARRLAGAGQGLRAGRGGRGDRRRPHLRLHAKRSSSCSARWTTSIPTSGWPALEADIMRTVNTLGVGHDGVRRRGIADRLQGRRAEPAARELLRLGGLRLLGVSSSRRRAGREDRRDHAVALSRSRRHR